MFGINLPELLIILGVALLVFGPDKLPEVARTLGKLAGQARRASDQVRREFYNNLYPPAGDANTGIAHTARELRTIQAEIKNELMKPLDPPPSEEKKS